MAKEKRKNHNSRKLLCNLDPSQSEKNLPTLGWLLRLPEKKENIAAYANRCLNK